MTIEQIKAGFDNFSYIIYSPKQKKAAIVDPEYDTSKPLEFLSANNLNLEYIIVTHNHSDHTGGIREIKDLIPASKVVASEIESEDLIVEADVTVKDNDKLELGDIQLKFILTPGHTAGGICIIVDNEAILTGDTLFIGDCGRTDLPGGSLEQMFKTLQEKIMPLPNHLIVYPGHDYGDKPSDTLGNQKLANKTLLAKSFEEFSEIP